MGSNTASAGENSHPPRKISRASLVVLVVGGLLVANVAFGMAYSVIDLHREASEAREAQEALSNLGVSIYSQATETALGTHVGEQAGVDLNERVDAALGALPRLPGNTDLDSRIRSAVIAYFDAVVETTRGNEAGGIAGPDQIETPAAELRRTLAGASDAYGARAERLDGTANTELILTIAFGLLMIGLLIRRFLKAREAADIRASRERRQAEARFRSLVQNSSDAILILEKNGAVRYASASTERVLHRAPSEIEEKGLLRFVHEDDKAATTRFCDREDAATAKNDLMEFRLQTQGGRWLNIRAIRNDLTAEPSVGGLVLNLRDLTEQKQLESQMLQAQKMEAVGQLAGGVAHDFNNLLSVIQNYAQFLIDGLPAEDALRSDAQGVLTASQRAADLTRELLLFSRKEIARPQVLDVDLVIREFDSLMRRGLPEDITLKLSLSEDPVLIEMDRSQLEQILLNLVMNARDAMPGGGTITITSGIETFSEPKSLEGYEVRPGTYATFEVSDEGMGMTEAVKSRIYEPFFTTKQRGVGTGLGLATVYGIVKRFEGYIDLRSEPGEGTKFCVYFPLAAATELKPEPQTDVSSAARSGAGRRILVVEDEPSLLKIMKRVLERNAYEVIAVENPTRAIELAAQENGAIDLLITDVVMPGLSGLEVSQRTGLKTLFVSGYTNSVIAERGLLSDTTRLLQKPFSPMELLKATEEALVGDH